MTTILIMGLPGSGKTTLANKLKQDITQHGKTIDYFNADQVRQQYNDWDFTLEGRIRQGNRMKDLAVKSESDFVICDFIAPLPETQNLFSNDVIIWMATVDKSKYEDTDLIFTTPKYSLKIVDYLDLDSISDFIINDILSVKK